MKKITNIIPWLGMIAIAGALIVFAVAGNKNQDIRKKAAVIRGSATLITSPKSVQFTQGTPVSIRLAINLQSVQIDGLQVVAKFGGTIPKDLNFQPALPPAGMRSAFASLEFDTATNSATLRVAYVSENPTAPFLKDGLIPLGTLTMTAPDSGTFIINFDNGLSKVTKHDTGEDILDQPEQPSYIFIPAGPTSPPTAPATPIPDMCIGKQDGTECTGGCGIVPTCDPANSKCILPDCPVFQGICRNQTCQIRPPSALFDVMIKFAGVTDGKADGAKATIRFVKGTLDLVTPPVIFRHIENGVYKARIEIPNTPGSQILFPGDGYTVIVKGEKHVSRKFCKITGQTDPCKSFESFTIQDTGGSPITLDFTGLPLDPGDLKPQDGKVDAEDIKQIRSLFGKACANQTDDDKAIGDLNYDGCVDATDAFLLRNSLQTRYDEN